MLSIATKEELAKTPICYQTKNGQSLEGKFFSNSQIEFENGEVLRVWNIDRKSNSIHQVKVHGQFQYLDIFSVILCLSTSTSTVILYFSLVCLICRYIIQGMQVALALINQWNEQENVNQQQCTVFRNLRDIKMAEDQEIQTYETILWKQVHVGQIICLQRGEIAPADLLILDSSEEFLHFQSELRFPCSATFTPVNSSQKGVIIDFAINLSGTIQFKNNQGTLKLKNDPKATQFTEENMIFRGEVLERTDWVYAIALVVGSNCQKLQIQSKQKKRQQNEFPWRLALYILALIPMITYDQSLEYPQYTLSDYVLLYMMINSFTIELAKAILHLSHMVHHQRLYRKVKEQVSITPKIDILEERDEYILLSTSSKETNQQKQKSREYLFKGCLYLENQSLVDISKTDLLVLELPESMFTKKYRVAQLLVNDIHYNLNYQRLIDRVIQMENKGNSHRVLINTNKSDIYEEMKPENLDMLIKRTPPLFSSQTSDETARIMIQYEKKIEEKVSIRKYSSVPKPINNSVSAHSSSIRLGSENDSKSNSPRQLKKQKSMKLPTSKFANNKSQNFDTPNSHYRKRLSSGEGLIGEYQTECNFVDNLESDEGQVHEILLSILLCNDLYSYFDPDTRQIVDVYDNPYDQFLINFASLFDYSLQHSSKIDNNKPYYLVQKMTRRYVKIQGETKVFEILAILKSTRSRKQKLSIMVRDPESFLLEEGALLYTREQTFQLEEGNPLNEKLHQMLQEGLISFVYSKRQLTSKEAQDILKRLSSPIELDVDDYYVQLEKSSKVQFILGVKRYIDAKLQLIDKTFDRDPTLKQNLFITLKESFIQTCLISDLEYNHLTVFLINFKVISSVDCIFHLHEQDTQILIFKFRQHIQYLLENQGILNASPNQENQKFIVINEVALQSIKASRYLKYHFQLLVRFSKGVAAYKLSAKSKGLLIKLLQSQYQVITTIGASSNNSILFSKSDYALNIKKQNNISKASHQIKNMSEIIQMMFVASPQLREQYTHILKHQIYRSILIGLQFYYIGFYHLGIDYMHFLLFTLVVSNATTIILKISVMELKSEYSVEEVKIDRQKDNHIYLVKVLVESFTVMVAFNMFRNTDTINQVLLLMTNIEIMEKVEFMFTHKSRYLIAFFLIVATILLAQLAYSSQYNFQVAEYYTPNNLFLAVISSLFCLSIKIMIALILETIPIDYQDALFKFILGNVRVVEENYVIQQRQEKTLVSINNMFKEKDIIDDQLQKLISRNDSLHVDALTSLLRFADKQTEKDYHKYINSQSDMQSYGMIFFEISLLGIRVYLAQQNDSTTIWVILIVQFSIQVCFYMFSQMIQNRQINYLIVISRWLFQLINGGFIYHASNNNVNFLTLMLYTLCFCMTFHSRLGIVISMGLLSVNMIVELIQQVVYLKFTQNELTYLASKATLIMIHLLSCSYLIIYRWEYLQRYSYIFSNKLLQEQKKLNDTLGLLMPRFIKERMTKGQISISEDQGEVSVLFCDICDFDAIIQSKGEKIVEFLDPIFRSFDQLCQSNDVQKIETVGKTYMAAAGLKDYDIVMNQKHQNSTQRVLEMAIGMMDIIRNMKYDEEKQIVLKIGIHYGRVVAGVIGAHKPQFSLIGDTVNTTSRVCSTGDKGFITVSEQAFQKVNHLKYEFILKQVEAKGKGLINTYQLQIKGKNNSAMLKYSPTKSVLQQKIFKQQISFKLVNSPLNKSMQNKTPSTPRIVKKLSTTAKRSLEVNQEEALKNSIELNNQGIKNEDDLNNLLQVPGHFMRSKSRSLNKAPCSEVAIADKSQQLESKTPKRQRGSIFNPNVVRRKTITARQTKIITDNNVITEIANQVGKFESQLQNLQDFKQQRSEPYNEIDPNQVEIPKKIQILKQQQNLTFQFISQLLKHKVDTYQNIVEESMVYNEKDHVAYYSIYEAYSQIDRSIMFMQLRNFAFIVVVNLLYFLLYQEMEGYIAQQYILLSVQITYSIIMTLAIIRLKQHIDRYRIQILLLTQFVLNMIISLLQLILINQDQECILQITQITALYLNIQQLQIFENNHLRKIQLLLISYMIAVIAMDKYWIPLLIYSIGALGMIYFIQKRQIQIVVQNYETNLQLESQKQKQDTILQHLLPNHIFEKFMSEHSQTESFTDVFEDATILFADIAGFTKYSSSVQPEQVVTMLRSLFISFDKCCHELNVYKLYTIGDCYVCMGIIDANNRNPAEEAINVALFGLKMIEIINNIKKIPEFQHLNMRIGVHTGKIIGGVVGIDVVRYDVYGEDVTIANKMESNGKEGHMMVSASTMELLEENTEDMFLFEESTSVFIPSRNENIEGYLTSFNESFSE